MKKRIGIAFDRPEEYARISGPADRFAEFEPESTIQAMEDGIRASGNIPVRLGGPFEILKAKPDVDLVWNIAEGYGSRNREAWVPVLCEMYGIPYLGSDAYTLSLSLNKTATKEISKKCRVPTPDWILAYKETDLSELHLNYPLFLKPNFEGTAKGISERNIVLDEKQLRAMISELLTVYNQEVIIEEFKPGAEFTCAVIGNPLRTTPVLERGICKDTGIGIHALEKDGEERDFFLSQTLSEKTEQHIADWSLRICKEMQVKHFARLDFKCDQEGNPFFLEINPLPTFGIDSTFAILAELEGVSYDEYLGNLLKEII